MSGTRYDVVGVGNAIVDIIARCDDAFLVRHGAPKGRMRLVDAATITQLYDDAGPAIEISGGSVANSMAGLASLGGRAAFIGKVADDEFGRVFAHDIRAAGVAFTTAPAQGGPPTARSLILVTPDGERTMNTYLGVSPQFDHGEIDADVIGASQVVYLEGYLFDKPQAKSAFREAADIAAAAGRKVALTLSDSFCVDRHRAEFLDFIRARVDILFANESEITALYETRSFDDAALRARGDAKLAFLTRSAKGSVIFIGDRSMAIPPEPVKTVVDTTGAGDLYAAGVLYGLTTGRDLEIAGRLGSLAAAAIIGQLGPRSEISLAALARDRGLL